MPNSTETSSSELTILDVLVILARSWRLLVIMPLVTGLSVYLILSLQVQEYRSYAVLAALPSAVASLKNNDVIERVVEEIDLRALEAVADNRLVKELQDRLVILQDQVSDTSRGSRVILTYPSKDEAASTLRAILKFYTEEKGLENYDYMREVNRLRVLQETVDNLSAAQSILKHEMAKAEASGNPTNIHVLSYSFLSSDKEVRLLQLAEARAELATKSPDVLVEGPYDGVRVGRSPLVMATLASAVAGFLILVFVFVRESVRRAGQDPVAAEKLRLIRRAFWRGSE